MLGKQDISHKVPNLLGEVLMVGGCYPPPLIKVGKNSKVEESDG